MHHTYTSVLSWSKGCNLKHPSKSNESITWISHLKYIFSLTEPEEGNQLERNSGKGTHVLHLDQYHIFEHHKNLFSPPFLRPLAILVDLDCASWASISFWFWLKCAYVLGSAAHLGCTESMQSQCRLSRQLECVYWPIWKQFTWQAFIKLTIALTQGSVLCCVLVDILLGRNMQFWQPLTEQQWSWPKPYLPTQAIFCTAATAVQTRSWALPLLNR